MDADVKLTALKKAYADIILSISKEASVRVMSSERKSLRYQHELNLAKDEGLRILLRLKQMMDFQISESQAASLKQQKKIDELEAQLQEAEDIVSDLRGELREVQAELERVKNKNLNEPVDAYSSKKSMTNNICSYQSIDFFPPNESSVPSHISTPHPNGTRSGTRDLPSIILRGKETGLYRNGCTQRIRACDRNRLDRDLSLPEENAEVMDKKNGKETGSEVEDKILADIELKGFDYFLTKRKRAVRQRKTMTPLCGKKDHYTISRDGAHSDGDPSVICARLSPDEDMVQTPTGYESENERNLVDVSGVEAMKEETDDENVDENVKGLSSRPVSERDFKYTFQRKRKRQASSKSEGNGSPGRGNEKMGDQKVEEPKRSSSVESARDSRRLAQVARQLISLSESKWRH